MRNPDFSSGARTEVETDRCGTKKAKTALMDVRDSICSEGNSELFEEEMKRR